MNQHSKKFKHKKQLGQHFLVDINAAQEIASFLTEGEFNTILEVGPGRGVLTQFLLNREPLFISEIDERLIELLPKEMDLGSAKIIEGDFLKFDFSKIQSKSIAVIGNFPYNISSQIVFKVIENRESIPLMVGMFQREMAARICASVNTKDYSVLTIWAGLFYDSERLLEVPPNSFKPPPKVHSTVIRLVRKEHQAQVDSKLLLKLVKLGFSQRRKKVSNAMASSPLAIKALGILGLLDLRAENITIDKYIELTNLYNELNENISY